MLHFPNDSNKLEPPAACVEQLDRRLDQHTLTQSINTLVSMVILKRRSHVQHLQVALFFIWKAG